MVRCTRPSSVYITVQAPTRIIQWNLHQEEQWKSSACRVNPRIRHHISIIAVRRTFPAKFHTTQVCETSHSTRQTSHEPPSPHKLNTSQPRRNVHSAKSRMKEKQKYFRNNSARRENTFDWLLLAYIPLKTRLPRYVVWGPTQGVCCLYINV